MFLIKLTESDSKRWHEVLTVLKLKKKKTKKKKPKANEQMRELHGAVSAGQIKNTRTL